VSWPQSQPVNFHVTSDGLGDTLVTDPPVGSGSGDLQLSTCPLERVVNGEVEIGMTLIGLRGAVDINFTSVGKRQTDVDS
jgi:hypothetical protein